MTKETIDEILSSPGTHNLVHEVLDLAKGKDCLDAYYDVLTAAEILKVRMNDILGS